MIRGTRYVCDGTDSPNPPELLGKVILDIVVIPIIFPQVVTRSISRFERVDDVA